jgi:ssDNA-binding replication factor A large subunit
MNIYADSEMKTEEEVKKIEDIQPLEENITVLFEVVEKGEIRDIYKRYSGETHHVCDFKVADDTAQIILTLWQDDIDATEVGQTYKLENGFVNLFNNRLRITKGRSGELSTIQDGGFEELNLDNNRSDEHHEDPRRRRRRTSNRNDYFEPSYRNQRVQRRDKWRY